MRSIQRHLLVWILGALSVGAVVLVIVSYFVALSEMNEILDDNLKQVALAVASHETTGTQAEPGAVRGPTAPLAELDFAVLSWTPDGRLVFASDPRLVLPFDTMEGPSRVKSNNEVWQVYTVRHGPAVVQAAQRVAAREFEAAEVAAKLVPLLVILVALIGLLLVAALRHGLEQLRWTADYVGERTAISLEPIAHAKAPLELHPMIHAINRLMQRLSETFAAQRRFVADAAHELRTPITALKLQVQLLDRAKGERDRAAAMAELMAGIERSEHLIAQLLALSRLEPGASSHETRTVDLGDLVRKTVGLFSVKAESRGIDLGAEVAGTVILQGDPGELTVLLNNLVENALRYTPAGGVVNVTASRAGDGVIMSVADTGPGIPECERSRVFDRFYRGLDVPDSSGMDAVAGSGLGLSIVKVIADRHGGTVTLRTPANGSGLEVQVAF